jgi:hypothetical protein
VWRLLITVQVSNPTARPWAHFLHRGKGLEQCKPVYDTRVLKSITKIHRLTCCWLCWITCSDTITSRKTQPVGPTRRSSAHVITNPFHTVCAQCPLSTVRFLRLRYLPTRATHPVRKTCRQYELLSKSPITTPYVILEQH